MSNWHDQLLTEQLRLRYPEVSEQNVARFIELYNSGDETVTMAVSTDEGWLAIVESIKTAQNDNHQEPAAD